VTALIPGYRITRQIGSGARSRIYAVEDESGRRFALKRVVRSSDEDDRFLEQVENEYAVGSKVEHPHVRRPIALHRIRKLLQVKELLLLLEYVEGTTLDRARPNRLDRFLSIFLKVAAGLEAMHRAGYVHSDIKPNNIVLGRGGVVKIIDFGQACAIGRRKERIQGTPDYIAPEQVQRKVLDQRTDVFNVGATMYWVLTSENYPTEVRGPDARGGIALVKSERPLAPIEINEKIPIALSNLVMECCRPNPGDRPSDMRDVQARLLAIRQIWKKQRETLKMKHLAQLQAGRAPIVDSNKDVE